MVDRKARQQALELLLKLKEQSLTNWQLEDEWPSSDDPALNCILRWLWTLYDDHQEELISNFMSDRELKILERCCDFLASEEEFLVTRRTPLEQIKTLLIWGTGWRTDCTLPTEGNEDNWPFLFSTPKQRVTRNL